MKVIRFEIIRTVDCFDNERKKVTGNILVSIDEVCQTFFIDNSWRNFNMTSQCDEYYSENE